MVNWQFARFSRKTASNESRRTPWERRHPCLLASAVGHCLKPRRQGCLRSQEVCPAIFRGEDMSDSTMGAFKQQMGRLTRRDFFKSGSLLGFLALYSKPAVAVPEPPSGALRIGPDIYQSIGV